MKTMQGAALLAILCACGDQGTSGSGPADSGSGGSATDTQTAERSSTADTSVQPSGEAGSPDSAQRYGPDAALDVAEDDTSSESGGGQDTAVDSPAPTCGPSPARYTLLTGADAGLVRDNVTMLVWMTDSHGAGEPPQTQIDATKYCAGRGMRLPTKDEAVELAASYASCAFGRWGTWTSTPAAGGDAWVVDYAGDESPQLADNFPSAVLCVRDPGDN